MLFLLFFLFEFLAIYRCAFMGGPHSILSPWISAPFLLASPAVHLQIAPSPEVFLTPSKQSAAATEIKQTYETMQWFSPDRRLYCKQHIV